MILDLAYGEKSYFPLQLSEWETRKVLVTDSSSIYGAGCTTSMAECVADRLG